MHGCKEVYEIIIIMILEKLACFCWRYAISWSCWSRTQRFQLSVGGVRSSLPWFYIACISWWSQSSQVDFYVVCHDLQSTDVLRATLPWDDRLGWRGVNYGWGPSPYQRYHSSREAGSRSQLAWSARISPLCLLRRTVETRKAYFVLHSHT